MEFNEEQLESIRHIINNIETKNRNKVLARFFMDKNIFKEDKFYNVFELYKNRMRAAKYTDQQSLELDIAGQLQIPQKEVNSIIRYIDKISKKIDYEMSAKKRNSYKNTYIERLKSEQNKVRRKNESKTTYIKKGEVLRRQLDTIIGNYDIATKNGKLSKAKLKVNINKIQRRIEELGNLMSDRLVLASMYADIGEIDKCNSILSKAEYDKLSEEEKNRYKNAKVKEIFITNVNYIVNLYRRGYSYEKIKIECEKQATDYRAGVIAKNGPKIETVGLTSKFIKKVYDEIENGKIKLNVNENEKEL